MRIVRDHITLADLTELSEERLGVDRIVIQ